MRRNDTMVASAANNIALYRHGDRQKAPVRELLTASEWMKAMEPFPLSIRYHAANLAAHDWDVVLVGDRLLVACAWSGGHWFTSSGEREAISDAEWDRFYPPILDANSREYANGAYGDGKKRSYKLAITDNAASDIARTALKQDTPAS